MASLKNACALFNFYCSPINALMGGNFGILVQITAPENIPSYTRMFLV